MYPLLFLARSGSSLGDTESLFEMFDLINFLLVIGDDVLVMLSEMIGALLNDAGLVFESVLEGLPSLVAGSRPGLVVKSQLRVRLRCYHFIIYQSSPKEKYTNL